MKINLPQNWKISVGKELPKKAKEKALSFAGGFLQLGERKLSGEKSVSEKLIEAYAGWVYINSSVLAEEVSKIELKLYQTGYANGQLELKELQTHELLDLLDRFNDSTTASDGFYMTESHLNLTGDSFWYTPLENGKPTDIFILRPDKTEIDLGDFNESSRRLINGYIYKDTVDGKQVKIEYPVENIIPFKVPNPGNQYRGKSTVEAIANDIDIDTYSGKVIREFFENGMIINFALSTDQRLNNDQISNFQSQLRSAFGGAKNAWKVPIFGGGIKPVEIQMSNKDSQLIENMTWFRDKIMIAFKNTPASIGIIEDVNRANSESTLNNWKQSTIKPKMKRIVDSLNEFLVPKYGDNLILGFENPVPEDNSQDKTDAIALYNGKIITRNEARDMIGYDNVTGGDEFLESGSDLFGQLPKAVLNVNYKAVFRRNGVTKELESYQKFWNKTLPIARKIVKNKHKKVVKEEPVRPTYSFDYEKVDKYAADQLKIVDHHEQIFNNAITQILSQVVEEGISNLDNKAARKSGKLVDKEKWVNESINKLTPIMSQVLVQAGEHANRLINIDDPYIPKEIKAVDTKKFIREQITLFMSSAIDTDIDTMTDILASGLAEELGVAQIRRNIVERFVDFTPKQAERITRTEVIKTSNLGAQDAFEQSGQVEAKQWLATEDDRTDEACLELDGKIVGLEDNYFDKGDKFMGIDLDYADVEYPPLHPNCRCVILPVLVGEKGLPQNPILRKENQALKEKIKVLESMYDKRTKQFKDIKAQNLDDKAYIKALEKYAEVDDGQASTEA